MKIKNLQINVLALLFGLAAFCFVNKMEANNATKSPEGQPFFDQNGDDVSGKNQKPSKRGATLSWDFHGPTDVSGKVTAVVHNSSDYNIVYVGAAHGGVWKSTDGTVHWNKISVEDNKNLYVTCLALDEASNVLYAGTGGDFTGQGVYKSEGGGTLKLMAGTAGWTNVYKIAVFGNKVYATTSEGLMGYTDGTWKVCTGKNKAGNTINFDGIVKDISVNKAGLVIIAVNNIECYVSKTGTFDGFEYKELDATMWQAHNISVTTSPADNNVLYVVAAKDGDGKVYKAFLSKNQGDNWEVILEWIPSGFIDPLEGNGKNINTIYADMTDPHTLYIASRNIWKGKRYAPGPYDFGLSAMSFSDYPIITGSNLYMHSNVRCIDFAYAYGDVRRDAYVATDGGLYIASLYISPDTHITFATPAHRFLTIGSYNHVCANDKGWMLMGTPTLGVQAIDAMTSFPTSARYIWDYNEPAGMEFISEFTAGPCAISSVNEEFYIYSLSVENGGLEFRRSINSGTSAPSFQPLSSGQSVEWFISDMSATAKPKYDAPLVMWESFNETSTYDTVWFKADTAKNFFSGDRTIFAPSKNFGYPIAYPVPAGFAHGDSIQVPDPVQNRLFVGLQHKLFMTREALDFERKNHPSSETPPDGMTEWPDQIHWYALTPFETKDTAVTALALSDDANTLYAGSKTGKIFGYTNLKSVYDTATLRLVERNAAYTFTKSIRAMAVDPTDDNHLVVVLEGGGDNVYESFNAKSGPATFELKKGNLPNNVYCILFPKGAAKGTIMAGTEKGIWMREGSSTTWEQKIDGGLGPVPVMSLSQMTTERPGVKKVPTFDVASEKVIRINYPSNANSYLTINAGTYGSGIFSTKAYVGIGEITPPVSKESDALVVVPNPVNDMATIELDMAKGRATIQIFSVDGRLLNEQTAKNTTNTINFKGYAPGTYIIQVNQGGAVKSGKVIKQ